MAIIYNGANSVGFNETAIALGTFDGLHIAHTKIINIAVEYGKKNNLPCGVMLFDNIPANSFSDTETPRLLKPHDRNNLLSHLDFIYVQNFDKNFSSKTPEEFVSYIKNVLRARFVSVGYNYRFGIHASGDADLLKKLCADEGIEVFISEKTIYSGHSVSSTRIRELISGGKVREAASLLGRNFFLTGNVIKGYRNGHKLGSPTANIELDPSVILPASGVYAGYCILNGTKHKCVINVGNNPTFNGNKITVESHLLDFDGEIYGTEIKVEFLKYLRGEIKFSSKDELAKQIADDIKDAHRVLASV